MKFAGGGQPRRRLCIVAKEARVEGIEEEEEKEDEDDFWLRHG